MFKPRLSFFSIVFFAATVLHAATPPVTLVQLAELTPSSRATNDWFGISIAVSGNTVVVADFDPNIETYGAVYVYVKPASGWTNMTQVAKLTSSDNGEGFGIAVSISGDTVVVGAANPSNFAARSSAPSAQPGAAYIFVKPASGWTDMTETAKLTASDGQPGDAFGDSVSINGPTVAIGAIFATDSSGNSNAGKAYVFTRPPTGWAGNLNETAKLTASDSTFLNYLGASVAVSGNTIVAGAYGHNNFQGAAYVFVEPAGGWVNRTQNAELTASDGAGSADFGFSSAIVGNTVLIGAPNAFNSKGAGYIFVKPSTGWATMTQTAELRGPNGAQAAGFGQSVSISGNAILIGAPGTTVGSNASQGAAFLFIKPSTGWRTTTKASELTASDGAPNDVMGVSVSISGPTAVAGAPKSSTPGSAYVFGP